jgi:hypothetical protein
MATSIRRPVLTLFSILAILGSFLAQNALSGTPSAFAADAPLTLVRGDVGVTIQEGGSLPQATVYGIFNDPDQCSGSGDFALTVDLGDGSPTQPDIVQSPDITAVLDPSGGCNWDLMDAPGGPNYYSEEGTYHLVWTVKDAGGNILTVNSTATVTDALLTGTAAGALAATEGSAFGGGLGTFSDANNNTVFVTPDCENEGPAPYTAATSEPDSTHYLATVDWGDGAESTGTVTRTTGCTFSVTGSHIYAEEGTYTAHVTVQDEGGSVTAWDDNITVSDAALSVYNANPNLPPLVEGVPSGDTGLIAFHDSDPGCLSADYSAVIHWGDGSFIPPSQIRVTNGSSPGDCNFTVVGNHTYQEAGSYNLEIDFYDAGSMVSATDTVNVADAPLGAVQPGSAVLSSNDPTSTEVLGTFRDGSCGELTSNYSVTSVNFGDGGTSTAQVSLAPSTDGNPCDIDAIGHHVYTSPGTRSTSVTVQDEDGNTVTVSGSSNVDVADAALTLVRGNIGETIPEGGSLAAGTIYGVFHDPDQCSGGAGDFNLTVDLGDGTPTQPDITSSFIHAVPDASGNCNWDVELDPGWINVYIEEGTYHVVWTVKDAGGNLLSIPSTIQVPDAPLTAFGAALPSIFEGTAFSGQLGTFTDANTYYCESEGNWPPGVSNPAEPDSTHYRASVTWGDGAVTDGTITQFFSGGATPCEFKVSGSHTYNEEGTYTIHVAIQDEGGSVSQFDSTVTVFDAPLTSSSPQSAINSQQHLTLTNELVGKFQDSDPLGTVADYSATIDWADGVQAPGIVERDPVLGGNWFDVYGDHTYSSAISQSSNTAATITVFDTAGAKTQWTDPVTVSPYDSPLILARGDTSTNIIEGGGLLQNFVYGIFDDPDECTTNNNATGDYTQITADLGDGTPSQPDIVGGPNGIQNGFKILRVVHDPNSGNTCLWDVELGQFWSNWYSETGVYHIVFTVQDAAGNTVSIPSVATVADAPSSSTGTSLANATEGASFTTNLGTFDDANNNTVFGPPDCENEGPAPYGPPNSEQDNYHYQASVDWGDGSSSNATLTQFFSGPGGAPCRFKIGGTHAYAEEGTYPVHVTIHDEDGGGTSFTDSIEVSDAGLNQLYVATLSPTEGQSTGWQKLATFSDADNGCSTSDYSATVKWGDGGTSPGSITTDGPCGFDVYGSYTYNEEGSTSGAEVDVFDHGASVAIPLTVNVTDAPLALKTPTTGGTANCTLLTTCGVTVAGFSDTSPNCSSEGEAVVAHYTATIDWGDGSPPDSNATVTQVPGTCNFNVTGNHSYTSPTSGSGLPISVMINDSGGAMVTGSVVLADVGVPPTSVSGKLYKAESSWSSTNFTIAEKLQYSNSNGNFNASLSFSDPSQSLSIPSCSTQPSASCRLTILGYQSMYTNSTAKAATFWARYVYTSGGSSITRYARIDLGDVNPGTADTIQVTMSSNGNSAVADSSPAGGSPPATYSGAVTIS